MASVRPQLPQELYERPRQKHPHVRASLTHGELRVPASGSDGMEQTPCSAGEGLCTLYAGSWLEPKETGFPAPPSPLFWVKSRERTYSNTYLPDGDDAQAF